MGATVWANPGRSGFFAADFYSDAGYLTCGGFPGSLGYEYQDARQYAAWGVDYLKYDWCHTGNQSAPDSYRLMRDALRAAGRPVVFSRGEQGPLQFMVHLGRTVDVGQ